MEKLLFDAAKYENLSKLNKPPGCVPMIFFKILFSKIIELEETSKRLPELFKKVLFENIKFEHLTTEIKFVIEWQLIIVVFKIFNKFPKFEYNMKMVPGPLLFTLFRIQESITIEQFPKEAKSP